MCGGTILLKYMLPQLIGPLAVTAATQLGTALVDIAGLSFALDPGEILCVAGESGCGKSTLLRALMGADDAAEVTAGTVIPAA